MSSAMNVGKRKQCLSSATCLLHYLGAHCYKWDTGEGTVNSVRSAI